MTTVVSCSRKPIKLTKRALCLRQARAAALPVVGDEAAGNMAGQQSPGCRAPP